MQSHHMKHILLSLSFFLATSFAAFAQLEISPNPWVGTFDDIDLSDFYSEPIAHAEMINTTANPLSVRWELVVIDAPEEWEFRVCDKNQCYSTGIITNWDPSFPIEEPVFLSAGESNLLDLHILPRLVAGTLNAEIRLSLVSDPNTVIATGLFQVDVLSSVGEVLANDLRIFPNPSSDYFALSSAQGVNRIVLYNIVGRQVRSYEAAEGKKYNVADLPDGIYLVALQNQRGEVQRTMRISKRSMRP